jgi:predicted RND superfamily exporter protein
VLSRYAEEAGRHRVDRREASRRTMRQMLVACLGAFATTAFGFYSLRAAHSQTLQEFGSQAAIGLCFLYVTVLFTLGALLPFVRPTSFRDSGRIWRRFSEFLARAGCAAARRPWATLSAFGAVAAAALLLSTRIEINSTTIETYDENHPTIRTLHALETHLSGLLPLEISLEADSPEAFYDAQNVRKVAELRRFAMQQDPVLYSRTYIDFLNEINGRFVPGRELYDELPRTDAEGQRRIARGRRFVMRVADQMRYYDFMTPDESRARLLLKIKDIGTRDTLQIVEALQARIDELFPPGSPIAVHITGDAFVNAKALTGMIHELLAAILTASLVIFGLVALLFRSLRMGLMTVPPNVIALVVTAGYMGLRGYPMNAGNVIVFTISLGIAVDNTIHYLLRFREEYAEHADMIRATWRTVSGKGRPMVLSTLLIVIGLCVLLLSDFVPTRRFAELTIITLSSALLGALLLLPACVALLWPGEKRPRVAWPKSQVREPSRGLPS